METELVLFKLLNTMDRVLERYILDNLSVDSVETLCLIT